MTSAAAPQLTIGLAQPLVIPGDVSENIRRMEPLVAEAARRGAGVVIFSEAGITGYDLGGVGLKAALAADDPALDDLAALAARHGVAVANGFFERDGETIYNSAMCFRPDGRRVLQRKHNVMGWEPDVPIAAGPRQREIFQIGRLRCAMLICADSGMDGIFQELADAGADVALCLTAGCGKTEWGFHQKDLDDPDKRKAYLEKAETVCFPKASMENALNCGIAIAACNQAGWVEDIGYFHPGHSTIVDRTGELVAVIPGRMVAEHVGPELAVGTVHARAR